LTEHGLNRSLEDKLIPLHKAIVEVLQRIQRIDKFRAELTLDKTVEEQTGILGELAMKLLLLLSPLLNLLLLGWIGDSLVGDAVFAALPSKEAALAKAKRALDAEERIIDFETAAIAQLDDHQNDALRDSRRLQRAMSLERDDDDDKRGARERNLA
jgi:hypothetical protein